MLKLLLLDECYQKPYPDIWSLLYMKDSFFFYFFFFGIYFVILSRYEFHNVHGFKNCGEDNFRRIFCLIAYYFWFCAMIFFFYLSPKCLWPFIHIMLGLNEYRSDCMAVDFLRLHFVVCASGKFEFQGACRVLVNQNL